MLEVIKKRRSHRNFQNKPVEDEKLKEILKAAMFAPSARHLRPWEFVIVKDPKIKDLLAATKDGSSFVNLAPVIIVICVQKSHQWIEDGALVGANLYLEATNQDLGTCWVQIRGSQRPDGSSGEDYVRKLLKIPSPIHVLCLMPIGYPKELLPEHQDSEFEVKKLHHEVW